MLTFTISLLILGCTAATTATPTTSTAPTTPADNSGGGGVTLPSPPPPIAIASFSTNDTTVYGTNFTITTDTPNELVISGTCGASEDGHTVEIIGRAVVGATNGVISSVTNTSSCTEAGGLATWTTTFTRDNLNSLQTNNMRASFSASITNDAGVAGEASPQNLFVLPNIPPHDSSIDGSIQVFLEDIYKIGSTCRLVFVVGINTADNNYRFSWRNYINSSVGVTWFLTALSPSRILMPFVNRRNAAPEGVMSQASDTIRNSNNLIAFTSTLYFDIPDTDRNSYEIGIGGTNASLLRKTYRNCQLVPSGAAGG